MTGYNAIMSQSEATAKQVCERLGIKRGSFPLLAARAGVKPSLRIVKGRATAFYTPAQVKQIKDAMGRA